MIPFLTDACGDFPFGSDSWTMWCQQPIPGGLQQLLFQALHSKSWGFVFERIDCFILYEYKHV